MLFVLFYRSRKYREDVVERKVGIFTVADHFGANFQLMILRIMLFFAQMMVIYDLKVEDQERALLPIRPFDIDDSFTPIPTPSSSSSSSSSSRFVLLRIACTR